MRGIIARVGGKSKLKYIINTHIPNHKKYIEPFIGGGSIFFHKDKSDYEVVNDIDIDVYNIFNDMKTDGEKIIDMDFIPDRDIFNTFLSQETEPLHEAVEDRLYRNLYISLFSFKGERKGYIGYKKEKAWGYGGGKKYKNTKYKDRLKNVIIENKDWRDIVLKYDSYDAFFYLDPPYSCAENNDDYKYNSININEMVDILKNLKGKFLLSYDKNDPFLNKGFNIINVETQYKTKGKPVNKNEYLIRNY